MEEIIMKKIIPCPSPLDLLSIINIRSPELFIESERLFHSLSSGEMGEQEVIRNFKAHGRKHWHFIRNFWADVNGTFESDLILITRYFVYVFEVKNYTGIFEYDEGIAKMNGMDINADCVFQARRSFKNIQKLLAPLIGSKNVKGALIFVGEHNEVHIHSRVEDIEIVQRNQLLRFIQKIAQEEDAYYNGEMAIEPVLLKLEKVQRENPFTADPLTSEQMKHVRSGIVCAQCSSFNLEISRKYAKCSCGYIELREEAMVRTICEYGVLRYDEPLRRKELAEFFGKQASLRYLTYILSTHFEATNDGKYTCYTHHSQTYNNIKQLYSYDRG